MESALTVDVPDASPPAGRRGAAVWRVLRHEWTLAILGGLLLATVLTWPTLRHPAATIPGDIGDPTLQAWQMAWAGHALLTDPASLWHSNTFYPAPYTFAYTDTLLGYAPAAFIGSGVDAAVVRYNILYVLLHAFAFVGGYALVRQLGAGRLAATVAGLAWAYAPWRLAHGGHMNVLSTGGIALALAMLARGHGWSLRHGYRPERRRPGWVVAGWLVAAWQITLGFAIGLPFVYFLIAAVLVAAAGYAWSWWRRGQRPPFGRRLLVTNLVGGAFFGAVVIVMALPYLKVIELNPQARRSLDWTVMFSPPLRGFITSPAESWLWGDRHEAARQQLSWPAEMALLPGFTLIVLAGAGLFFSSLRARHRALLAAGVVGTVLLGLGSTLGGDGDPGYLTLSKHLPGWDALRTPGRLMIWTSLLLAILAAGLLTAATRALKSSALRVALVVPLVLVFAESLNRTPHPAVPRPPAALQAAREPILVLPSDGLLELNIMLWSADGLPRIANGMTHFEPASQSQTRAMTRSFPDAASVAYLRDTGIRTVVFLPGYAAGTPWEGVGSRPIDGLDITREEINGDLVFHLFP